MKGVIILNLSLLMILSTVISCSHSKKENVEDKRLSKEIIATADTSFLKDKNFPIKNMVNTISFWRAYKFYNEKLYKDSTHKISFVELTKYQKLKLIVPFISKELNVKDVTVIEDNMAAFFIAKQNKIGEFQPIVLFITGDDYSSLLLVVLNKFNSPVSGFNLCGGLDSGPYSTGDSLTTYHANSYSFISLNQITTYRIDQSDFADSIKKPSIIDSNVFVSIIDKTGKIKTKQTVKAQFRRTQ